MPGIELSVLAWVAPIGLLLLIQRRELTGNRPLLSIWLGSLLHWTLVYHFVRLPHWSGYFAWAVLAFYLSFYFLLFVVSSRVAIHKLGIPLVLGAPACWVGCELLRGHLLTGLSTGLLGHTQYRWLRMIQISDLFGGYAVSFVMMSVAAGAVSVLVNPRNYLPTIWAGGLLVATLIYGTNRMSSKPNDCVDETRLPVKVALIQGAIDTVFPTNQKEAKERFDAIRRQYRGLTIQARDENPDLDLLVWPEAMFQIPEIIVENNVIGAAKEVPLIAKHQMTQQIYLQEAVGEIRFNGSNRYTILRKPIPKIIGMVTKSGSSDEHWNTAAFIKADGRVEQRYHKSHLVPMGEYLPLGDWLPWLYQLTPIPIGTSAGVRAEVFEVGEIKFAPNICFESIVPHHLRRQMTELDSQGNRADVMVNITNDGWFWGSNALDLHLASNVFRAVELRRPMLVCANTGISAEIDAEGRMLQCAARQQTRVLVATVRPDLRRSFYESYGDWLSWLCMLLMITSWCLSVNSWYARRREAGSESETDTSKAHYLRL